MSSNEFFRNFLRRLVKDSVIVSLDEVLAAWCAGCSVAQKRPTSIQASQPTEIGSVWRWRSFELLKRKVISSFIDLKEPYRVGAHLPIPLS